MLVALVVALTLAQRHPPDVRVLFAGQKGGELGSTYKRDFSRGVGGRPFGSKDPGLRSEEMITVGQFTAVPGLRSWAGSS